MPRKHKPTPHVPFTAIQSCQTKRQFKNEPDATKAAELQMLMHLDLELSVYLCDQCKYWHLTRQKR